MPQWEPPVDTAAAVDRLMRFLAVEGITGQEAAIGREVVAELKRLGVAGSAIKFDDANSRIPLPTQTGNLIVTLPGANDAPRLLFMTHLDTVPLCAGAVPTRKGNRIVPAGPTALGGDNRTGVAVLVTLVETLLRHKLPHPPLTLLFTVREESGLFGARYLDPADLGGPKYGFNFDGKHAAELTIGAVGAERWEVEITGKAAHAGVAPEKGISATAIFSLALADIVRTGWFGKVIQGEKQGTSNVGNVAGADGGCAGQATNVVTDYVKVLGESRSHDPKFTKEITTAYKAAFRAAAEQVRDAEGRIGKVKFTSRLDYYPFRMKPTAPAVKHAKRAAEKLGLDSRLKIGNGGLDANWMNRHKIPTVTLGAGQNEIHTQNEFIDVNEFLAGCRMAVALAIEE